MVLHILADYHNVVGRRLVLNYMQIPPTHYYLDSSGWWVAYMETHANYVVGPYPINLNSFALTNSRAKSSSKGKECHSLWLELYIYIFTPNSHVDSRGHISLKTLVLNRNRDWWAKVKEFQPWQCITPNLGSLFQGWSLLSSSWVELSAFNSNSRFCFCNA